MGEVNPEFYPPRAGRFSGVRNLWAVTFRRIWWVLPEREAISGLVKFLLVALLPAWGMRVRGWRMPAMGALAFWIVSGVTMIVFLGRGVGTVATGLLVGIHTFSATCGVHPAVFRCARREIMVLRVLAVVFLVTMFYRPLFQGVRAVVFPLETSEGIVVVNRLAAMENLAIGDLVAYRVGGRAGGIYIGSGYGMDPVLALPGQRVRFAEGFFEIDGHRYPSEIYMPMKGGLLVPSDHWFIWPSSMRVQGNVPSPVVAGTMMMASLVTESEMIGRPFTRWFWRKQIDEPVQ